MLDFCPSSHSLFRLYALMSLKQIAHILVLVNTVIVTCLSGQDLLCVYIFVAYDQFIHSTEHCVIESYLRVIN